MDYLYVAPGFADCTGQITISYPSDYSGDVGYNSGFWVGQWNMENPATHQSFSAFCLSPTGLMYPGLATFNPLTPDAAKYGLNPSAWSTTGGIENAVYLWNRLGNTLKNNTEGAALGLALWAALYNSTAVGEMSKSGRFSVLGTGFTQEMQALYASDITTLNTAGPGEVVSVYQQNPAQILRPVSSTMQDLIIPGAPPMAPEPNALFALALLLSFSGGQWLRDYRSSRKNGPHMRT
jgi:hypothetical protein